MKKAPELTGAFLRQPSIYLLGCEKRALRLLTTGSLGVQERTESKVPAICALAKAICQRLAAVNVESASIGPGLIRESRARLKRLARQTMAVNTEWKSLNKL